MNRQLLLRPWAMMLLASLALSALVPALAAVESNATNSVIGHLPVASAVTIAPAAPKAGETVTATWAYTDVDGDAESGTLVEWLLDGLEPPVATGISFALPSDAASKNLRVRITPRSQAPADPAQGNPVTTKAVTIAAKQTWTGNFTKPSTAAMTWPQADAYCKGLTPAARLPTRAQLQSLFVSSTSATAINQTNYEMCDIHGWPLSSRCGGRSDFYWTSEPYSSGIHWYVRMFNGVAGSGSDTSTSHVTCVR